MRWRSVAPALSSCAGARCPLTARGLTASPGVAVGTAVAAPKSTGCSRIGGILPAPGEGRVPTGLEEHPRVWIVPTIMARGALKWLKTPRQTQIINFKEVLPLSGTVPSPSPDPALTCHAENQPRSPPRRGRGFSACLSPGFLGLPASPPRAFAAML